MTRRGTVSTLRFLFALLAPLPLIAQEEKQDIEPGEIEEVVLRAGFYGAGAYHLHRTTANVFVGGAECGAFGDGEGKGLALGAFVEFPIRGDFLDLYASLGYTTRGGSLGEAHVGGLPILDPNSDEYTFLERRHTYQTDLAYLRSEFGVRLTLPWYPLYIRTTASIDFPQGTTFEQGEEILSPEGVLYPETNMTTREVAAGDLADPEALLGLSGGIGYELPLATRLHIAPEISYYHPFSDVVLNRDWRITSLQAGAALRWTFGPIKRLEPPVPPAIAISPPPPPPRPDPPRPKASVSIASPETLSIVKTVVTETFPILPYIFFDSGSTRLPARYRTISPDMTEEFDEKSISWESLEAYHDLLNVLGKRMAEDRSINIALTGTTDGLEAGGSDLARARAEMIRDYLVQIWKIDPDRMTLRTTDRPRFPSSDEYPEGNDENRRVEITSSDGRGLEPIIHRRFSEYSFSPDEIRLNLGSNSTLPITSWKIDLVADGDEVHSIGGEGPPPSSLRIGIDQRRAGKIAEGLGDGGDLAVQMSVRSGGDASEPEQGLIPTSIDVNPFEISRLSLIVFDFDRSEIVGTNRSMVVDFVADALSRESSLTIVGSTDRLGELEHNQALSTERAESVRSIILSQNPEADIRSVEGIGAKLRYDNDLPEGRYYCRTVTVEVTTPVGDVGG